MRLPSKWQTLPRFLSVGALNTIVGYVLFITLYYALGGGQSYRVALVASYVLAACSSYVLHRRFTFQSKKRLRASLPAFFTVHALTLGTNALLLDLAAGALSLPVWIAQLLAGGITATAAYVGHAAWTFAEPPEEQRIGTDTPERTDLR